MEDLIKKLENIKTPDIEIRDHKQKLKMALLSSEYFREKTTMKPLKSLALVGIPVLAVIVLLFFTVVSPRLSPLNTALFEKDESELNAFDNSLVFFDQRDAVLNEIDQTFSDILDESPVVSAESAIDPASIEKEASEVDYSDDLTIFNEGILQELDQVTGEVSQ